MADLVKRLRNGFDNIPTVLEWEAADAIEELTAALRDGANAFDFIGDVLHTQKCPATERAARAQSANLRNLLSKYEASKG